MGTSASFAATAARARAISDDVLATYLKLSDIPERHLIEAMRYAVFGAGKRFRASLCLASGLLFSVPEGCLARIAAAIEAVHCYSLVHDDLPSMDDDDIRRGRASVHRAFDEATAILAGDALVALAFEILSDDATHPSASVRLKLVYELARTIGLSGMVGGQMIDIGWTRGVDFDLADLSRLHRLKTGSLISFTVKAGAWTRMSVEDAKKDRDTDNAEAEFEAISAYGDDIGLAFQIRDDLDDIVADTSNFARMMGSEQARAHMVMLIDRAIRHLNIFGARADVLIEAAQFVITRNN